MNGNTLIAPTEKHRAIIELREQRMTHQEVGDRVGVTWQYVQQVLTKWRPDLCGRRLVPRTEKTCLNCEATLRLRPSQSHHKYCNRACNIAHAARTLTPRQRETLDTAKKLRAAGASWCQCARALGWTNTATGTRLAGYVRQIAAKTGEDVSACFGKFNWEKNFSGEYAHRSSGGAESFHSTSSDTSVGAA